MSLQQIVDNQNKRLIEIKSIYRFKIVGDDLVDLVDIEGAPTHDDDESRYIEVEGIEEYTSNLIEAELSCR